MKLEDRGNMRTQMQVKVAAATLLVSGTLLAQKHTPPADQWPVYQYNSNFSPLKQITPENVSKLTEAWTFHYGAGSKPSGSIGLDYRFEVQPLIVGGVMYISTPGSPSDPNLKATIS